MESRVHCAAEHCTHQRPSLGMQTSRQDHTYKGIKIKKKIFLCLGKNKKFSSGLKFKNGYPSEQDAANSRLNLETGEFEIIKPIETFSGDDGRLDCYQMNGVNVSEDLRPGDGFPLDKFDLHRDFHRRYELKKLNDEYFPALYEYSLDQDKPNVIRLPGKSNTDISEDQCEDPI